VVSAAADSLGMALVARELLAAALEAPMVEADKHVPALQGASREARKYRAARHRYAQALADYQCEGGALAMRRADSARQSWAYAEWAIICGAPTAQVAARQAAMKPAGDK
jgi:hypothetical protein